MAIQAILDKVSAIDTKEDAIIAVLGDIKTDVDNLKQLVGAGNLQAVSDALDALGTKVDAVSTATDDLKTDAAG